MCEKIPLIIIWKKSPLPIFWSLHVSVNLCFIKETRREQKATSKKRALAHVVTVSWATSLSQAGSEDWPSPSFCLSTSFPQSSKLKAWAKNMNTLNVITTSLFREYIIWLNYKSAWIWSAITTQLTAIIYFCIRLKENEQETRQTRHLLCTVNRDNP